MTEQHQAIRLLNAITFALDPLTPFIASTPQQGATHGYYLFANLDGAGMEGVSYIHRARATAYMEVGCPAPGSADLLRRLIPASALMPPVEDPVWRVRSAWDAWDGRPDTWLCWGLVQDVAGPSEDLDDFVHQAQLMQAALLQQVVEEARRQQPRCSAVCVWVLNEPWPTAANLSITSFPAEPKPAVNRLAAAGRRALLSLRLSRLQWRPGEAIECELWLLEDRPCLDQSDLRWQVELRDGSGDIVDHASGSRQMAESFVPATFIARLRLQLPAADASAPPYLLAVRCADVPALESDYAIFVRPGPAALEES